MNPARRLLAFLGDGANGRTGDGANGRVGDGACGRTGDGATGTTSPSRPVAHSPIRPIARSQGAATREAGSSTLASSSSLTDEDRGWRSLISGGMRELTWAQIIENLNNATEAYRTNPLAFRLIQLQVDHVLGDGMVLRSSDPTVQAELDIFWHHPLNTLAVRQFDFLTALALDGEIFPTIHTNPYDGTSYLRLVPASLVDRIETNPDDLWDELRFHQTAQPMTPDTLMRLPSALQAEGRWWDQGEMWHFAVNRPAGVVRGQSDLAPLLPWLRRYRDWLTDRVRLNKYRSAYLWHITLKGADRRGIVQRQAELAEPPRPGSVIVSNENELWEAVQPDIKAADVTDDGLAIRLMIAAGAGVPLYWLAEAEHTARGTASEMSEPTYRHYRQRQLFFGWAMRTLAVEALHRRGLAQVTLADVVADFPELDSSAALETGQTVAQLASSLGLAQDRGWLSQVDAAAVFQHFLGETVSLPAGANAQPRPGGLREQVIGAATPRPVLPPTDARAREPIPPPFPGGGLVAPEPITNV